MRRRFLIPLIFVSTTVSSWGEDAAEQNILGFKDHHKCIYDVAERFSGPLRNMVSGACFRMFKADNEKQRHHYECIVELAATTADTETIIRSFQNCGGTTGRKGPEDSLRG